MLDGVDHDDKSFIENPISIKLNDSKSFITIDFSSDYVFEFIKDALGENKSNYLSHMKLTIHDYLLYVNDYPNGKKEQRNTYGWIGSMKQGFNAFLNYYWIPFYNHQLNLNNHVILILPTYYKNYFIKVYYIITRVKK